jgi:hypothetical protein
MSFLHKRLYLGDGEYVLVEIDVQANVLLTDDSNFSRYRNGESYRYYGGLAKRSPVRLTPPYVGYWNATIDFGGAGGSIRHSIRVVKA